MIVILWFIYITICFRNICVLFAIKPLVIFRETKTLVDVSLVNWIKQKACQHQRDGPTTTAAVLRSWVRLYHPRTFPPGSWSSSSRRSTWSPSTQAHPLSRTHEMANLTKKFAHPSLLRWARRLGDSCWMSGLATSVRQRWGINSFWMNFGDVWRRSYGCWLLQRAGHKP